MTDYDDRLLRQAIIHYKAGEFDSARNYLERALATADDDRTRLQAYFYLSEMAADPVSKRQYLEDVLAIDMAHADARRSLAILDGRLDPGEIVDPDALPAPAAGTVAARAERFTCPKCGGRMVYAPDGVSLFCEYCQREQSLRGGALEAEQDFFTAMASGRGHRKPVATQTFRCQGCGAEFLLAAQEMSAVCSYCDSAHVVRQQRELAAPDAVIPLALEQDEAARRLAAWLEAKRIEPDGRPGVPRGLYLPVWTFDIVGSIPWKGYLVRNKRQVPVSDTHALHFDDIVVPAARRFPGLLEKALAGFDFAAVAPYDPRYLAGWPAEVYEIAMSDASLEARRVAVEQVHRIIRSEHGHVLGLEYSTTGISVDVFKLVLAPLWVGGYTCAGREYRAVINGVTGAVHGETPERGPLDWLGSLFAG